MQKSHSSPLSTISLKYKNCHRLLVCELFPVEKTASAKNVQIVLKWLNQFLKYV